MQHIVARSHRDDAGGDGQDSSHECQHIPEVRRSVVPTGPAVVLDVEEKEANQLDHPRHSEEDRIGHRQRGERHPPGAQ
jgi:hypothetical protein